MTKKRIAAIRDFIDTAEKSLKNAKKLLREIMEEENIDLNADLDLDTKGLNKYESGDSKIVEGVFTGEEMLGVDNNKYPVPVNYASKSKLVQGDKMKLTIDGSGKMLYKQIKQIERETKVGLLTQDKGKYQVVSDGVAYDVLTAAVTHFKSQHRWQCYSTYTSWERSYIWRDRSCYAKRIISRNTIKKSSVWGFFLMMCSLFKMFQSNSSNFCSKVRKVSFIKRSSIFQSLYFSFFSSIHISTIWRVFHIYFLNINLI